MGCKVSGETVVFNSVYSGKAANGMHARALANRDEFIIVGGKEGQVYIRNLDTTLMPKPYSIKIEGIEDFRDVHFQNSGSCIFMNSGKKGTIYMVARNGFLGEVYDTVGVFLDGMAFWEDGQGIVYGDPVNGDFFLANSTDNGVSWQTNSAINLPDALEGEAGFAASGTGIQTIGDSTVYFVTGSGKVSRLFCSYDRGLNWVAKNTPMKSGGSYGIYSTYFMNENEGFIIGGSYQDTTYNKGICQYTTDGGDTWIDRSKGLLGYCSCIQGTQNGELLVATGRMGTFYTMDKGKKWELLTIESFYTCNVTNDRVILVGKNGNLMVYDYTFNKK